MKLINFALKFLVLIDSDKTSRLEVGKSNELVTLHPKKKDYEYTLKQLLN